MVFEGWVADPKKFMQGVELEKNSRKHLGKEKNSCNFMRNPSEIQLSAGSLIANMAHFQISVTLPYL
jgi:hypothetical protein